MLTTRITATPRFRTVKRLAGLTLIALCGVAIAANPPPAAYLKGTFQFVDFSTNYGSPPQTTAAWATATFDGAGNMSISGLQDTDRTSARDVITGISGSQTYQVAADGTITLGNQGTTGRLSGDGNVLIVSSPGANDAPEIFVAIRTGSIGGLNTASGPLALGNNTTGVNNTAVGYQALYASTTANYNAALGFQALYNSQSGLGNVGVGPLAGQNIVKGQLNIDIGSWGSADESNTIRIGIPQYHLHTYIAGVASAPSPGGTPVVVDPASGQLGFAGSSERFKTDITSLAGSTERLSQLRPVSFHLRTAPDSALQYGLIAEEVDKVYPELVIRDTDGRIQGIRYDELAPMLLNELQRAEAHVAEQDQTLATCARSAGAPVT